MEITQSGGAWRHGGGVWALWLVRSDHMTSILASDWSTWRHGDGVWAVWCLIESPWHAEWARDVNTVVSGHENISLSDTKWPLQPGPATQLESGPCTVLLWNTENVKSLVLMLSHNLTPNGNLIPCFPLQYVINLGSGFCWFSPTRQWSKTPITRLPPLCGHPDITRGLAGNRDKAWL